MQNVIWFLVVGSKGGPTRARILRELKAKPSNAHQLAKKLGLDYKGIQYQLGVLEENGALDVVRKGKYGAAYFISRELRENWAYLEQIW